MRETVEESIIKEKKLKFNLKGLSKNQQYKINYCGVYCRIVYEKGLILKKIEKQTMKEIGRTRICDKSERKKPNEQCEK